MEFRAPNEPGLFPLAHFCGQCQFSGIQLILKYFPWEVLRHSIRKYSYLCFPMNFVHILIYLVALSFPVHPRTVNNSFPFSLLTPFKYLQALSYPAWVTIWHSLMSLVFIASAHKPHPLCLNRLIFAFSRERRMGVAKSYMRRPRGGLSFMFPLLCRPLPRPCYLICTCHVVLFFLKSASKLCYFRPLQSLNLPP